MMNNKINGSSQIIGTHLSILQNIIQRMAGNSSSVKTWCVTLVSALIVVVIDKGKMDYLSVTIFPILLFFLLDTYYLALERGLRNSYSTFVKRLLHEDIAFISDLYEIKPEGGLKKLFFLAIFSASIWPFYLTLVGLIFVIKYIL